MDWSSDTDWTIDTASETPPSRQLALRVLDALAAGELDAGAQLPSVRQLAAHALVNHNTVARAYRDLEQLGVVRGENGLGVFVTPEGPRLARAERSDVTLQAFRRATDAALRAGHSARALVAILSGITKRKSA